MYRSYRMDTQKKLLQLLLISTTILGIYLVLRLTAPLDSGTVYPVFASSNESSVDKATNKDSFFNTIKTMVDQTHTTVFHIVIEDVMPYIGYLMKQGDTGSISPAFKHAPASNIQKNQEIVENYPVFTKDMSGEDFTIHEDDIKNSQDVYEQSQDTSAVSTSQNRVSTIEAISYDVTKFQDVDYLKRNIYTVDRSTDLRMQDFPLEKFMRKDLSIDISTKEPKVLIFHTHAYEAFVDSDPNKLEDGVVGLGSTLAKLLEEKYGIHTIHHTQRYDLVNGVPQVQGAYERMEPDIQKVLKENPSIEVVIDIHRDGVADETIKFVEMINGKPTAKLMFFNGLTKRMVNGQLVDVGLHNPYLQDNLAFSFQMQLKANAIYPNLTRKLYLHAYRYSLHFRPRSLLVEVGAQTNTKEEAQNAMEPLAHMLAEVLIAN